MEFFNDTSSDQAKPSLFELVSQENLTDFLQPALKYVLVVLAHRYPRYILRIVNVHEEFYAGLMLIVESYYLRKHGASFSENFYGLKRRRRPYISTERSSAAVGGIPRGEKLRNREIYRSLLFLVGIPYLRAKAQDYYEELGGGSSSEVVDDHADMRLLQSLTGEGWKPRLRRAFKSIYPYLNTSFELLLLLWNIGYLFDKTPNYRPWLGWVGVDIRRLGPEDFQEAAGRPPSPAIDQKSSLLKRLGRLLVMSPRLLLDSLRLLLPTAIFFIRFLEWWYSPHSPARSLATTPQGPTIPPPSMLPPHPQGIPFDRTAYGVCPICNKAINNATALPSGLSNEGDSITRPCTPPTRCQSILTLPQFGKQIQAQQVPGWSTYYLDYKFLKKIISSLAAGRPASEAAALALGVRPHDPLLLTPPQPQSPQTMRRTSPAPSPTASPGEPPIFPSSGQDLGRGPDFRAHKAAFFFKLERELEKINGFYLQKEAELILRMETLLSKRRAAAKRGLPDISEESSQVHVEWSAVEEGFRLLERDLVKLQQFVEINAIGFRKILKKYDKRSKSTTKELYLARQVDVQPVFNRQLISELADTVATCLLNITDLSSGLRFEGAAANDIFTQQILTEVIPPSGPFRDLENNFHKAIATNDTNAIRDSVHYSDVLSQQSDGKTNVTRILWNVILEAPPELADLILATLTTPFDYRFVDDINARSCLHEAAITGARRMVDLCIQHHVPVDKQDAYGRTALHYAAMKGNSAICQQLLEANASADLLDHDNISPLVYATLKGDVATVRTLFDTGKVSAQMQSVASVDFDPLSLAAQAGHLDVVILLLDHGAVPRANSNGEFPMHLAAREGHADVCRLLLRREGWDTPDKYHEWTPLFHAARYGREECVRVLVEAGCRTAITDELGYRAAHYAAWYGHDRCFSLLLQTRSPQRLLSPQKPQSTKSPGSEGPLAFRPELEIDLIPSLSLPPPIMPHRVYGHNYLVNSNLVQISVGRAIKRRNSNTGVRIHHRSISPSFKDEALLVPSPLKLVLTAGPHVNAAPYTVSLPQTSEEGSFSFQVPSISELSIEFSLYPNFGTKTIGRAVALPALLSSTDINNKTFTLPILDNRLHVIGEVDFEVNVITPFKGVTLEIGGDLETYWKSTVLSGPPASSTLTSPGVLGGGSRSSSRRPNHTGSAHASPAFNPFPPASGHSPLTISSLQGDYVYVVVQVTRDLHPVVFFDWLLPEISFELGVADVTLAQFESVARSVGRNSIQQVRHHQQQFGVGVGIGTDPASSSSFSSREWARTISQTMMSLSDLLKILPLGVNVAFDLASPSRQTKSSLCIGSIGLNDYVDSVLATIFQVSDLLETPETRRKMTFMSFSPDICSALNWKQPNYPVFFGSACGKGTSLDSLSPTARGSAGEDQRAMSVGAAVEFAKANNLLGLLINGELLVQVPSLIDVIRGAELLVTMYGDNGAGDSGGLDQSGNINTHLASPDVDAHFRDNVVVFADLSSP